MNDWKLVLRITNSVPDKFGIIPGANEAARRFFEMLNGDLSLDWLALCDRCGLLGKGINEREANDRRAWHQISFPGHKATAVKQVPEKAED